jgi:hypothetical protein
MGPRRSGQSGISGKPDISNPAMTEKTKQNSMTVHVPQKSNSMIFNRWILVNKNSFVSSVW